MGRNYQHEAIEDALNIQMDSIIKLEELAKTVLIVPSKNKLAFRIERAINLLKECGTILEKDKAEERERVKGAQV